MGSIGKLAVMGISTAVAQCRRLVSGQLFKQSFASVTAQNNNEENIKTILKKTFPKANLIEIDDISGGCGSMYEIHIESEDFASMRTVAQHKLVTDALKEEVKKLHGLRIFTTVPK